jgi:hypothetical protein
MSQLGTAYQKAADYLSQAQSKLALSQALGAACKHYTPSTERLDYCADLEKEAYHLFELSMETYKRADKLAREAP